VIAAAMLYAILMALLLGAAAYAAERLLGERRLPTRGIWATSLVASVAVPAVAMLLSARSVAVRMEPVTLTKAEASSQVTRPAHAYANFTLSPHNLAWPSLPELDPFLAVFWIASSSGVLALLAVASLRFRHNARGWQRWKLDDATIVVADRTGPAVFGVLRPRIVIPNWLTEESASTRSIAIDHERQHIAARDPLLFAAALLLVVLIPWNVPLWWQLRRLRFAIEVDCDSRLLSHGVDAIAYGETLLAVGGRRSRMPIGAIAMIESVSQLERRVRLMLSDTPRRSSVITGALITLVLALGASAAELDPPAMELRKLPPAPSSELGQKMAAVVAERYPRLLSEKAKGVPLVTVLFKADGSVDRATYELLPNREEFKPTEESYARRLGIPAKEIAYVGIEGVQSPATGQTVLVAFTERKPPGHEVTGAPWVSAVVKTPDSREIDRSLAERYFADVLKQGVAAHQRLWVLLDSEGRVLRTGQDASGSSPIDHVLKTRFPGIETQYVTATPVTDQALKLRRILTGEPLQIFCIWLRKGSPLPQGS
jgi:beta-lactamase regulating signal transducer with metallopeptidase domain